VILSTAVKEDLGRTVKILEGVPDIVISIYNMNDAPTQEKPRFQEVELSHIHPQQFQVRVHYPLKTIACIIISPMKFSEVKGYLQPPYIHSHNHRFSGF
jgi:hypothetical protein